jgi:hypothetical protein
MYQAGFLRTVIDGLTYINEFFLIPASLILTVLFIYLGYPLLGIHLLKFKKGCRNKNVEFLFIFLSLLCVILIILPISKSESDIRFGNSKVDWGLYWLFLLSLAVYYSGIFISRNKETWAIITSWIMAFIGVLFSLYCAFCFILSLIMIGPPL